MSYDYANPWVAGGDALETLLAERALAKLKQAQEKRAQEAHEADLLQQKEEAQFRKEEMKARQDARAEAMDDKGRTRTQKVVDDSVKGDIYDAETVADMRKFGILPKGGGSTPQLRVASGAPVVGPMPEIPATPQSPAMPGAEPGTTFEPETVTSLGSRAERQLAMEQAAQGAYVQTLPEGSVGRQEAEYRQQMGVNAPAGAFGSPTAGATTLERDYVTQLEQQLGRPLGAEEILAARKKFQQTDDRPAANVSLRFTDQGLMRVNADNTATPITDAKTGTQIGPQDTAQVRNKREARKELSNVIGPLRQLSKEIITKVGPAQRADALKRGAAAVFGNDPKFRAYQDGRMAIAGNLAVAQQGSRPSNPDVERMWLPLVPDGYTDTSESATLKWQLIDAMQNLPAEDGAVAPPAGSSTFRVKGSRPIGGPQ